MTFAGATGTLCSATLNDQTPDTATCTTTYSGPGTDSVTAAYGGDTNYATSASTALAETITQDQTSTTLSASPGSPVVGQPVTYTATVAPLAPGSGTPSGLVNFTGDNGLLCTTTLNERSPDEATCVTTYTTAGTGAVTASYLGDTNDLSSSSGPPAGVSIGEAATDTSVTSSDPTPVVGEIVTYTATVVADSPGSGTPTGSVTFTGSGGTICTSNLNEADPDVAVCSTTYTAPDSDAVTATYNSDGNYASSTSTAVNESISVAQTTTTVSSSPTSPVVGQPVTYSATVAPVYPGAGTPTGGVTFTGDGGTLCASASPLDQSSPDVATCTVTYASALNDSVVANYSGDGSFAPSASPILIESITPATTSTQLQVDDANPIVGQTVTFTATVSVSAPGASTPTGNVTFAGNAGTLCTSSLSATSPYTATCTTSYPAAGSDAVTATYVGDADDLASTSTPVTIAISPAATTTTLTSSASTPEVGQPVTFTATVTPIGPGSGTASGLVTFADAGGTLCTTSLDELTPDQATCISSFAHIGTNSVTATYAGTPSFDGSTSGPTSETVSTAQTSTSLSANVSSAVVNQQITFTAAVTTLAPGGGTPSGTVVFAQTVGKKVSTDCTSSLSDTTPDVATCTTSYAATGTRTVTATFKPTPDYAGSASDPLIVTVGAAGSTTTLGSSVDPSVTGQAVTFTATVSAVAPSTGTPTGKVTFTIETAADQALSCTKGNTQTLSAGTASCTISATKLVASGSPLDVLAGSAGSSTYQPSATSTSQGITPAGTTLSVSSSAYPSKPGQAVNFAASVQSVAPGSGTPTGSVTFSFSPAGSLACSGGDTVQLNVGGKATCKMAKGMITSPVTVTATYPGSSNYDLSSGSLLQALS